MSFKTYKVINVVEVRPKVDGQILKLLLKYVSSLDNQPTLI